MHRSTLISLLLLSATGLFSCKAGEQAAQPAAAVDYQAYQSYQIASPTLASSDDPSFSWIQFKERIKREINFILPAKGLEQTAAEPDLLVYYYALVDTKRKPAIIEYNIGWAAEPFIESGESFSRYAPHTLVVDLVDAHTGELVWRSSTRLPFDSREQLYEQLPGQLRKLFKPYPAVPNHS